MTTLLIEPEAEEELAEAALWYEEQKPRLGRRFLAAVAAAVDLIRSFPKAGAPVPYVPSDLPARRTSVKNFPYHVVYLFTPDAIHILAFAHHRRRPGYWIGRRMT